MLSWIKKVVGTKNEREIKRLRPLVELVNALEPEYQKLTDDELRAKTEQFKNRLQESTAAVRKELGEAEAGFESLEA